ncbi:MAG: hypothetical protein QW625_00525 [Candidatus Nanoarchaeia archaeon]
MRESKLLIIASLCSILGLFLLIIIAIYTEPREINLKDLENHIGQRIIVKAEVKEITYKNNVVFLTLRQNRYEAYAVYFNNPIYDIFPGDFVVIKGKVQIYKDKTEIVIEELACLSCENV